MVDYHVVVSVLEGMQGTLLGALVLLFLHAVLLWWRKLRGEPMLRHAQGLLAEVVVRGSITEAETRVLKRLPLSLRIDLFTRLAPTLQGAHRERLQGVAGMVGLIPWAENRCRSRFWWRRLRGVRLLTDLGGGDVVVSRLLDDRNTVVRAQALEWATSHPAEAVVASLMSHLGDADPLCRFTAMDSLIRLGGEITDALAFRLESLSHGSDGTWLEGALKVASCLVEPRFLAPALRWSESPRPRVRALCADVLGGIGGTQGIEALRKLLVDAEAEVRVAAARALGRLAHWPAADALAARLRDPSWDVRRAAGMALLAMGSPGILFLRRFKADEDRSAASMALRVLKSPEAAGGAP